MASPRLAKADVGLVREALRRTVVGASGSFLERKSAQERRPGAGSEALRPAIEDLRRADLVAAALAEDAADQRGLGDTSVPVQCWGGFPNAAYSAGILLGSASPRRCRR